MNRKIRLDRQDRKSRASQQTREPLENLKTRTARESREAYATRASKAAKGPAERGDSSESTLEAVGERLSSILAKPQLNYIAILIVTALLAGIGLTMVLSSSMVNSRASGGSVYTEFLRQAAIVFVGFIGMWFAMKIRPQTIRRFSGWLIVLAFILLVAVLIPGVGVGGDEVGSNSWIRIGSVGIQPSEAAKLALAVWGSAVVAKKLSVSNQAQHVLGPFIALASSMLILVALQKDLGMMFSVGIVVMALAFFAGLSARVFGVLLGLLGLAGIILIIGQAYRSARITTWFDTLMLNFNQSSTQGSAYQSHQGILSISDGSLFGLGLGQSRAKWFYLPEATNDFIFAVVGEELGFVGAFAVVALFAFLGWFGIRTAIAHKDPFMRMLSATLTLGVVVQAFINMGYVVGYLPVTGIQLPLISAGGTSAVITLISMGLLANCARHEPETVSSMQHEGRPLIDRILRLPEPHPVVAGTERREERRTTTRHYGEPVTRQKGAPGRTAQDVRREKDRLSEARRRVGVSTQERDYDGRRRSSLPPARPQRGRRTTHSLPDAPRGSARTNRPDRRKR